ncbi:MAG TPA: hypothetical protein VNA20_16235 [Frankiaceae bacterium]|nr:hypothetical protein [Frankiaceae bacterium]
MKALVPPPGGGSIADALRANQDRRDLLQLNGIRVPIRYAAGSGCVVEEYIQFGLWEFLEDLPPASASVARLCDGLVSYAVVLDQLGFAPIDPFVDLRTDGQDVIPVDFGQDLGPAAVALAHSRTRWLEDVLFYVPRRHKKRLQPALAAAAERYLFDR